MNSYIKKILKTISLIIFSILITIYMIEVVLSLYNISGYKYNRWAKLKRSKYEIYTDYKNSGKDIAVAISPSNFFLTINDENKLYPLSGISNKFTIFCNESGYWSTYQSDRYGFNNPDEEWDKSHFDFLLVGDSFTLGACVKEPDTISGNLRSLLNQGGVLNLGYSGNGPLLEYATLREYFKYIEAKNVLWLYYESDLHDFRKETSNKFLIKYLENLNFTQDLIYKQKAIDKIASDALLQSLKKYQRKKNILFRFEEFNFKNVLLLKSIRHRLFWVFDINLLDFNLINSKWDNLHAKESETKFYDLNKFSDVLVQANNLVTNNNSKLYFVYLPTYFETHKNIHEKQTTTNYEQIINLVEKLNIPIIDINKDLFSIHSDPKSLFPKKLYGHYNELGYRLVAETILKKIIEYENIK